MNCHFVEYKLLDRRNGPLAFLLSLIISSLLSEALGLGSGEARAAQKIYFVDHEEWLCDRANHNKWNPAQVERLLASKMITTDQWFKTVVELGYGPAGVETATLARPVLHSLHLLLKKKVDEKLAVQAMRARAAAKDMAAGKQLEAATTLVDAADRAMAAAEIRTESTTIEAAAGQTRCDAADQETQLIQHRTDGALREEEPANLGYNSAKGGALHSLHLLLKKKVDETLEAQPKRAKAAAKTLAAERELAGDIRTEGATLEIAAGRSRVDHAEQEMVSVDMRTGVATLEAVCSDLYVGTEWVVSDVQ
ncbi:hypothetical protein FN846DRAFT_911312 [Sphaerosporella brunnea]|uniref:Uncharacterized protein n=1 Tax=Sphaerosporella brunnea TaxID=1250544 RepID=A0A5J5EJG8_9PEZI|nr:hypothetical protein FN846DRAFT_911312 [Sphaerosporella brunnea]